MDLSTYLSRFETASAKLLAAYAPDNADKADSLANLRRAVHYAMQCGGKRIRPTLIYCAAQAVGSDTSSKLDHAAVAIELVHTYSLIHDDLPAMDDDDLRRGRATLHRAFDEATAILVGDGMQVEAFQLITAAPDLTDAQKMRMIDVLARAAGFSGMVGGQFIDIEATGHTLSLADLQAMHAMKTGALIRASLALGAIAASATTAQCEALESYGEAVGLAFQVVDDILDVEGDSATLGKTGGKDVAANKATYVQLLGLAGARAEARRLEAAAITALQSFSEDADPLRDLAAYIVGRDH